MMRFAMKLVEIKETVVIVDAEDYNDAHKTVADAYNNGEITFNKDNSIQETSIKDITDEYNELFGKETFQTCDVNIF